VLGDMGEVGERGAEFHREVGAYARRKGVAQLLALGEATRHAVEAFGEGARHFDDINALVSDLKGKTILVKGSRFMKMERVVAALTGAAEGGHRCCSSWRNGSPRTSGSSTSSTTSRCARCSPA
jgi:UDP-N-acetylmuramoyl-tripeptide--D-alanyl-D-alanine ligase